MNAGAMLEREPLDFRRRPRAHRAAEIEVVADENAFGSGKSVRGVDDLSDLLVGPRSAPIDLVVLFPKPSLELQSDLAGAVITCSGNGGLHRRRQILLDIGEHRERDRGDTVLS